MVTRLARFDLTARRDLIGGLYREQRRLLPIAATLTAIVIAALCATGALSLQTGLLLLAALRRCWRPCTGIIPHGAAGLSPPTDVFRADALYVCLLVAGAVCATFAPAPATVAAATLGGAAIIGALPLTRALWRHEAWNIEGRGASCWKSRPSPSGRPPVRRSTGLQPGLNYLVAGTLSVAAVAAVGRHAPDDDAHQPAVHRHLHADAADHRGVAAASPAQEGIPALVLFAIAVALLSMIYSRRNVLLRDWIFDHLLHKHFPQRDLLLRLWS